MASKSYIFYDIITGILLRLPVPSLLRFKAVCRRWLALTKSFIFIRDHCHHPSNPNFTAMLDLRGFNVSMLWEGAEILDRNLPLPIDLNRVRDVWIVGSANGLLCLSLGKKRIKDMYYLLWNPATGQHRRLPPPFAKGDKHYGNHIGMFGYHQGVKDYKIVQIADKGKDKEVKVLALSRDSWREVKGVPEYKYQFSKLVVLKGVWYFLAILNHQTRPFIVAFDMGNDTFSKLALPEVADDPFLKSASTDFNEYDEVRKELMVYKELLAIGRFGYWDVERETGLKVDIWAMKNESWTKLLRCQLPSHIIMPPAWYLGTSSDDEIIIASDKREIRNYRKSQFDRYNDLCFINPSTQQWRNLIIDKPNEFRGAHTYMESLASVYTTEHPDKHFRQ